MRVEGESRGPEKRAHRAPLAAAVRTSMAGPSEPLRELRRMRMEGESGGPERKAHRAPLEVRLGHKETPSGTGEEAPRGKKTI